RMGILGMEPAQMYAAAQNGDPSATQALALAGRWLGIGIANIINALNPAVVIVGGEGVQAGAARLDAMQAAIDEFTYAGLSKSKIVIEYGGNQTWARGAASLVLDRVFQTPVPGGFIA
ncbi:MAG TPA: ROK family protein, partial [Thermoflexales bacterium]|nr:ROK family protein [Thermoflexales bacterium]